MRIFLNLIIKKFKKLKIDFLKNNKLLDHIKNLLSSRNVFLFLK